MATGKSLEMRKIAGGTAELYKAHNQPPKQRAKYKKPQGIKSGFGISHSIKHRKSWIKAQEIGDHNRRVDKELRKRNGQGKEEVK